MSRLIGTHARAVRAPIISQGDDLQNITVDCILAAAKNDGFELKDRDIIGVTESLLARSQGNYLDIEEIAEEAKSVFADHFVVLFPILSRNRFSHILKGLAMSGRQITVMLSYPSDEVGNHLMDLDAMYKANLNPHKDVLSRQEFRKLFGHTFKHPFTGLDYIDLYMDLAVNNNIEVVLANDPFAALSYSKDVLVATIHDRKHLKNLLLNNGGNTIIGLDELATKQGKSGGYNPEFGLLGSNLAGNNRLKLFPRDAEQFCYAVQKKLFEKTGKTVEVLVYGDGAFKDPVGKIWELADPVVAPGFTAGLMGTPNEIKMKYIADNELVGLSQEEAQRQLKQKISQKGTNLLGQNASLGTTPRQLTDLLGTLCDLMSGSGDKGTPIIHIQGYFDNYASD
ncbi:coenzyme F420-0:L-glutamate ligase [Sphaerochaeta sp.]|uniref:coenzyme F420-0:L-glutamate ligase n=1 Tax=Sphaerochaeta sp. TaxID=1972642 RepID=UPI00258490EA|nr:coenzyme F420-0:L-glutamate ligase [Sphaerochaeta sp.]MDD3457682.1 coenzyme F420-0:L-glutamate ligase [Sphaerochaeta sp.]